jgi:hypothetical protein
LTVVHTINESIDISVFYRWRKNPKYRPPNLFAWANKHGIDPVNITSSVRADDPALTIPSP